MFRRLSTDFFRGRPGAAAGVVLLLFVVLLMWLIRSGCHCRVLIDVPLAQSIASGCGYDEVHGVLYIDSERFLDPVAITAGPDRVTAPGLVAVPTWLDLGHSGGGGSGWWWRPFWSSAVVRLESVSSIRCVQRKLLSGPRW